MRMQYCSSLKKNSRLPNHSPFTILRERGRSDFSKYLWDHCREWITRHSSMSITWWSKVGNEEKDARAGLGGTTTRTARELERQQLELLIFDAEAKTAEAEARVEAERANAEPSEQTQRPSEQTQRPSEQTQRPSEQTQKLGSRPSERKQKLELRLQKLGSRQSEPSSRRNERVLRPRSKHWNWPQPRGRDTCVDLVNGRIPHIWLVQNRA
ncbi:hypothetical protein BS47DRAFT_268894 [Hydnum rufescens UP504]|uniref:Uncharacterized protein n=1 Tax=Hydnum rufescens UP504 TaxID=1448309 RepID=A0A9P6ALD7_9AGAM|nr:hypothetical protein BS47DRAFT_268894 [Hydnum rufescens UP504]